MVFRIFILKNIAEPTLVRRLATLLACVEVEACMSAPYSLTKPRMTSRARVPTIERTIDPRHPSRFENRKNIAADSNVKQQGTVLGACRSANVD